jgi:FkbM family methyltransferase
MPDMIALPRLVRLLQRYDLPKKLGIFERLYSKRLARHGVCWVQTAADIPWKLDLAEATHRWIVYGKYEGAPFLNWARSFLPADGVVVDSGANIGQILLYLAQWTPRGRILAIEPGREQADWLEECLKVNPQLPVEIIRSGLGDKSEIRRLSFEGQPSMHGAQNRITDSGGQAVQMTRLEDELAKRSITQVHLWKLDVEGFEISALSGAEALLRTKMIRSIYVELHGENGLNIVRYLERFRYDCHLFAPNGALERAGELPGHTNGLFFPRWE